MSTPLRPELLAGLFDDAAIFPPGDLPLAEAVPAHTAHLLQPYAAAVGPLVVRGSDLPALGRLGAPKRLAVVQSGAEVHASQVYVEVPRDHRRGAVIEALAASGLAAKLRTGGLRADLFPSPEELAADLVALVLRGIPFKATAGLHHAVRITEPTTGFEHHGFLNVLVATGAARAGADVGLVARLLAERDEDEIAARAQELTPDVRASLCSIGTCSIVEPLDDLRRLGLLPTEWDEGAA